MKSIEIVSDIMDIITRRPTLVYGNESLRNVALKIIKDPMTQAVYVVNDRDELIGIITLKIVLQYLYHDHIPPDYLEFDISVLQGENTLARDVMLPPIYVKKSTSLSEAFKIMFKYGIQEIPVVDDAMHVIGDLHGMELIHGWLKSKMDE